MDGAAQQLGGALALAVLISIGLRHEATLRAHGVARLVASVQGDALILKLTAGLTLLGAVAVAVLFENVPLVRDGEASRNTPDAVR